MFLDALLPTIRFPQNPNLVFRRIPFAFDVWCLSFAPQTNTSHGPKKRGHVSSAIFPVTKDRPVLFSALAWSDALITLDRQDFVELLGREFYGLAILTPADFLGRARRRSPENLIYAILDV